MTRKREEFRDVVQNTPEWMQLRAGLVTASHYAAMMAEGEGKMRDTLIHRVAAEIITGEPIETYSNGYMERGKTLEPEARTAYALHKGCDPEPIGFIRYDKDGALRTGCSPDSTIGKDGLLEIKTEKADLIIKTIFRDEAPTKHKAQVQGQLMVSGREWLDLFVFCRGMPRFIKRVTRDEPYIKRLSLKLKETNEEIDTIVKRIRARM